MNSPVLRTLLVFAVFYTCSGISAFPARPFVAQGIMASNFVEAKFDPFGGYAALGRQPPEFHDFDSFQIDLVEPPENSRELKVAGYLSAQRGELILDLKKINLTLEKLSFTTEARNNITYSFDGRFLRRGSLSRFSTKVPVLEGMLTKSRGRQKIAETKLQFFYFEPH